MRSRFLLLLLLAVFCRPLVSIAATYEVNQRCEDAMNMVMALRFDEAKKIIAAERKANPGNLFPYYIENTMDIISIYISEEEARFDELEPHKDIYLSKLKSGDASSPYYLYLQAEVNIQWAFARLKFEEYLNAFNEIKRAYGMLKDNDEDFPDFLPNQKSLGMLHCLFGAIPDQYKWGANILGLSGDIDAGLKEMRSFLDKPGDFPQIFVQETTLYYAFLVLYLQKDYNKAWNIVKDLDTRNNMLFCFCKASVALRTGRCDAAISTLQSRPTGNNYFPFPFMDFMLGLAKTRRLDSDANRYFESFLVQFKGKNYIKEAYQKMGWNALIAGDMSRYKFYMERVKLYGDDVIDDDKQALLEAESGIPPNVTLLKARLLFDGGYYKTAIGQLEGLSTDNFKSDKDKTEFTYRAGRIYHESGNPEKAKGFYAATIKNGGKLPYYYAASAALQLGLIYEHEGNKEKAAYYYNACLNMPNKEYETSLDSQAKAGLNRIK
ncbi:MAG: tetratricopeptide repeat protein [Chitinophagales bacterium]|nr:tetratricopeptide repeat protein [Chitinophagales bacterium]HQU75178.1 hypothetical protein [Chitinophagales bacterium]